MFKPSLTLSLLVLLPVDATISLLFCYLIQQRLCCLAGGNNPDRLHLPITVPWKWLYLEHYRSSNKGGFKIGLIHSFFPERRYFIDDSIDLIAYAPTFYGQPVTAMPHRARHVGITAHYPYHSRSKNQTTKFKV
jgi:hypothetical protein